MMKKTRIEKSTLQSTIFSWRICIIILQHNMAGVSARGFHSYHQSAAPYHEKWVYAIVGLCAAVYATVSAIVCTAVYATVCIALYCSALCAKYMLQCIGLYYSIWYSIYYSVLQYLIQYVGLLHYLLQGMLLM